MDQDPDCCTNTKFTLNSMRKHNQKILVRKYSGAEEQFDAERLRKALRRSQASQPDTDRIVGEIEAQLYPGIRTKEIYRTAFQLLKERTPSVAARYNLKRAIMELGPTGFPFENYVAELLKVQGFNVQVGVTVQGKCVTHEIDVIAQKGNEHFMIECKYHNQHGQITDVKVALYINARFQDVAAEWRKMPGHADKFHQGWVVTNTRLTSDALQYGSCAGLRLWAWDYPNGKGLKDVIDQTGLYPLTCLTTLSTREKEALLAKRIVLCMELCHQPELLRQLSISAERLEKILAEGHDLCHTLIKNDNH